MEVSAYLKIIARYWWVILLAAIVSTGAAVTITVVKSKSYTANARVLAQPASVLTDTRSLVDMTGQVGYRSVMNTFAQVFTSADVRTEALKAAGIDPANALDYPIEANVLPDSSVIQVSARGHDPLALSDYVNATVDAAVRRGSELYRVIELVPLDRATVPVLPTSPVPSRDIPVGAGLGLALGILLAFAIEYMRTPRRIEGEMQIRALPPNAAALDYDDRRVVNAAPSQNYLTGRQPYQTGILRPDQDAGVSG
ncbi:MAG: Wzz/FepE/Etk N-terminal domain-containing protein [Chloroflexota bacterium]